MKQILSLILILTAAAAFAQDDGDRAAVQRCLFNWKKAPFKKSNPDFRTISGHVRVLGSGGEVEDGVSTKKPELVLVKPNVTVLLEVDIASLESARLVLFEGPRGGSRQNPNRARLQSESRFE